MGAYFLSGVRLDSELPLDAFAMSAEGDDAPLLRIALASPTPQQEIAGDEVVNTIELDGVRFLSAARRGDERLLRIHGWADFSIEGDRVVCLPIDGPSPQQLAQLFVDRVLPHILPLFGIPTLHAAVVALERGAVALVGEPGKGKSTLAAELAKHGRWLCDDCAALSVRERVLVHPSYPFVRLNRDALEAVSGSAELAAHAHPHTRKWRLRQELARAPTALSTIYALGPESDIPSSEPLSARDALAELARHLFRLDPTDRAALGNEMALLERLVAAVPVVRLSFPRRFALLPAIARQLAEGNNPLDRA
jgi:hypothetical protein